MPARVLALAVIADPRRHDVGLGRLMVSAADGRAERGGGDDVQVGGVPGPPLLRGGGDHRTDVRVRRPALIERWNGAKWAVEPVALAPGAHFAELRDVACTSPRNCLAVGTALHRHERVRRLRGALGRKPMDAARARGAAGGTRDGSARRLVRRETRVRRGGRRLLPGGPLRAAQAAGRALGRVDVDDPADPGPRAALRPSLDDVSCSAWRRLHRRRSATRSRRAVRCRWPSAGTGARGRSRTRPRSRTRSTTSSAASRARAAASARRSDPSAPARRPQGIAERWDGTGWNVEPTPGPLSGPSQLLGRHLRTSRPLLGRRGGAELAHGRTSCPLLERRTPAGWQVETGSLPAGRDLRSPLGVSCSGGGRCTSVGWWGTAAPACARSQSAAPPEQRGDGALESRGGGRAPGSAEAASRCSTSRRPPRAPRARRCRRSSYAPARSGRRRRRRRRRPRRRGRAGRRAARRSPGR